MRKVIVVVWVVAIVLALSIGVLAFQDEPDGFRGLKWGDAPSEEMEYYMETAGVDGYLLPNDKMAIGNVSLYLIVYSFYENQFLGVTVFFKGEDSYNLMRIICEELYGKNEMDKSLYDTTWMGQKAYIRLKYDYTEKEGSLSLGSTVLVTKKITDDKKKEAERIFARLGLGVQKVESEQTLFIDSDGKADINVEFWFDKMQADDRGSIDIQELLYLFGYSGETCHLFWLKVYH